MKILKKWKYLFTIIIGLMIIVYICLIKRKLNNRSYDNIVNDDISLVSEKEDIEDVETNCNIDIKGAINNPGVYSVKCDLVVNDVINIAGGVTDNADTSVINLAKKISNEMVIIIYTHEEVKNSNIVDTVVKVVENECVCPNIKNDGCLNDEINDNIGESNLININESDVDKLQELPGIGESKAKAIIKFREDNGKFKDISELLNVDGIGSKLYEEIKIYITT